MTKPEPTRKQIYPGPPGQTITNYVPIQHDLNTRDLVVQIWNDAGVRVEPEELEIVNDSLLRLRIDSDRAWRVVIVG